MKILFDGWFFVKFKKLLSDFRFHRKIQVHLLTVFLFLLATSIFAVTRFTYEKYYKDIGCISSQMIGQVDILLRQKIENLKEEVCISTELIKGSLFNRQAIIGQDPAYEDFLISILGNNPVLAAVAIATPEGDYFNVINVDLDSSGHFYFHPSKKLPEKSQYIVRTIRRTNDFSKEEWKYLDGKGAILAREFIFPASADFRENSWLLSMLHNPSPRWSYELLPREVSKYSFDQALSITFSDVKKNANEEIVAVLSMGVTLKNLSQFIHKQVIGKNGQAFILDTEGKIKVPLSYSQTGVAFPQNELIEDGYTEFKKNGENNFSFMSKKKKYLFSIHDSTIFQTDPWFVAIVVPFNDFFGEVVKTEYVTRGASLLILIIAGLITFFSVERISRPIVRMVSEVDRIRNFDFSEQQYFSSHIKEIFDLESSISAMRAALHSFGRYIPKEIVKTLVKYGKDVGLGGEKSEVTVMFCDIENFTTISESLPIEQLMKVLTEYFDVISKIILEEGGTIDKYIGDSVMSFWGAPIKRVDHAETACLAGLRVLMVIRQQKKWTTRFGIHMGEVIVGNIGTSERMNYTIIGDVVNVASRLEEINKEYHTSILISEEVHKKIGSGFISRPIDFVAVKGKKNKLKIFELMGTKEGVLAATADQIDLAKQFTDAYQKLEAGKTQEALQCFLAIEKNFPTDGPTKKQVNLLKAIIS